MIVIGGCCSLAAVRSPPLRNLLTMHICVTNKQSGVWFEGLEAFCVGLTTMASAGFGGTRPSYNPSLLSSPLLTCLSNEPFNWFE
jgi:hypothetical protein